MRPQAGAVGPPLSDLEMGFANRHFKDVGKRLLSAIPLAKQVVAADDSVLGVYSRSKLVGSSEKGLVLPYAAMVSLAFQPQWWATTDIVEFDVSGNYRVKDFPGRALRDNEYAVAEFNFSPFFGLAIQLYEATLISDDAPIDRYFDGNPAALTRQQVEGLFQANACATTTPVRNSPAPRLVSSTAPRVNRVKSSSVCRTGNVKSLSTIRASITSASGTQRRSWYRWK